MVNKYYECHITMQGDPVAIQLLVEEVKWKFSEISGDIILGDGLKCYATRHYNAKMSSEDVLALLLMTAANLEEHGINVIRRKVELVIYDDRSTKIDACNGACPECHLDDMDTV